MIAGVVGAEGAFRGAEVAVCDILMSFEGRPSQLHVPGGLQSESECMY